ncbi:ABC transporter permease [Salinimonas marina]|uniref:ABC transporter permease n=1 Tax=Salinimonas marina TaxID=2785918 RepID=A0A7S9DYQ9_9ALTE|nr:ABC transporter permease [Salinimonas marina]QPG05755.1 ABC transporter permease [Salinimonas marina]
MSGLLAAALHGSECALQAICKNGLRTMLVTLGVVIGVAFVVAVTTVMQHTQQQTFARPQAGHPHLISIRVWPAATPAPTPGEPLSHEDFLILKQAVPGLMGAYYKVTPLGEKTSIRGGGSATITQVIGTQPRYQYLLGLGVQQGRFITHRDNQQKILNAFAGPGLVKQLNIDENPVGQTLTIANKEFNLVGVGLPGLALPDIKDNNYLILPHSVAVDPTFASAQSYTDILFTITKNSNLDAVYADIQRFFSLRMPNPPIIALQPSPRQLTERAKLQDLSLFIAIGVAGISLTIGGLGIMNCMLAAVTQRSTEISMARAMGASRSIVVTQFVTEAGVLALFGGAVGLAVGYILSVLVMLWLPMEGLFVMPIWTIVIAIILSLTLGIVFGLLPAIKAAELDPVDTLHYE